VCDATAAQAECRVSRGGETNPNLKNTEEEKDKFNIQMLPTLSELQAQQSELMRAAYSNQELLAQQ